jgi:hypothetical protein
MSAENMRLQGAPEHKVPWRFVVNAQHIPLDEARESDLGEQA